MKTLRLRMSLAAVTLAGLASLVGCGGATTFEGGAATQVAGTPPPLPAPPPPPPPKVEVIKHVQVKDDQIVIDEKIQFAVNKSDILPASNALLEEIAATMKEHTEIKKVEVQGHASSEGGAELNKKLSDARAKAVAAALTTRGIPADALTAKGYGIEVAIGDNKTEEGREKNRRVEFHITDPAPKGGTAKPTMAPDSKLTKADKKAALKGDKKDTTATPAPKPSTPKAATPKKDEKKKP